MEPNEISLRSLWASRLGSNDSMRPEPHSVQSSVTHFPGPQSTPFLANDSWVHPTSRTTRNDSYGGFERPGEDKGLKDTTSHSTVESQESKSPPPQPSPLYRIFWGRSCKVVTALAVPALLIAILALSICIAMGVFQHEQNGTTETGPNGRGPITTTNNSHKDTSMLAAWPTITASASIIHVHMEAREGQSEPTTLRSVIITRGTSASTTARTAVTNTDCISEMRYWPTVTVRQALASGTQRPAQDDHCFGTIIQCERKKYSRIANPRVRRSGDTDEISHNSDLPISSRTRWF